MKIMVQIKEFIWKKIVFGVKTGFLLHFLNSTRDLHLLDQFIGANVFILVTIKFCSNLIKIFVEMKQFIWKEITFGVKAGFPLHF